MAVRFDADGEDYTRALSLGSQTALTACWWWKISTDRNTYSSAVFLDNGQTDNWGVQTGVDGTTANTVMDGNTIAANNMTVGTWYFGALATSGTTGTFYYKAASAASLSTTAVTGVTATNVATLRLGESPWDTEWLNGCLAAVKIWTAQLTQAEIELEAAQYVPNRVSSLVAFYPLLKPETTDYSGNARTLSGGTGVTQEDGPPVPWRVTSPRIILPAASGSDGTAAPAATAVTAGAPQATPSVADTAAPDVIAASVTLPQATPVTAGNATPATIAATVSLPQTAPSAGVTVSPVAITAVTAMPQAGVSVGAGPVSIPVTVTLPQATPQAGGNTTVAPASIDTTVSVPRAAINVTAGPTVVATTVTLPPATAAIPATTSPSTILVAVTVPAAGLNTAARPVAVSTVVTLPAAGASVAAGPIAIPVVVTLPQAAGVDEGAQVNGTSVAQVSADGTSIAQVSALAAVAAITQRGSSTSTVSDG